MARVAGVNIPNNAHVVIGLQAIYGIGASRAKLICNNAAIAPDTKVKDLTEGQLDALREQVGSVLGLMHVLEKVLVRQLQAKKVRRLS